MRRALCLALLLAGCAHSGDGPREQLDPDDRSHFAPGMGEPDPLPKAKPLVDHEPGRTCMGPCPEVQHKPCGGKPCNPGEYCDNSSGMERCQKDVVPASSK